MCPASISSAPAIVSRALVDAMNSSALICLLLLMSTPDCASVPPSGTQTGDLVVYSATFPQTLEQSEYPAHTDYTIATPDDKVIEHVTNATGTFNSRPARVSLPPGQYHVRAQYNGGRFITVPVSIEPNETTVIDLDGETIKQGSRATAKEVVRLPNGRVVGWSATSSGPFTARTGVPMGVG
jgi:hypothetical protein